MVWPQMCRGGRPACGRVRPAFPPLASPHAHSVADGRPGPNCVGDIRGGHKRHGAVQVKFLLTTTGVEQEPATSNVAISHVTKVGRQALLGRSGPTERGLRQ